MRAIQLPFLAVFGLLCGVAMGEELPTTVVHPVRFDVSPKTLGEIPPVIRKFRGPTFRVHKIRKYENLGDFKGIGDAVVQTKAETQPPISDIAGFEGIGEGLVGADGTAYQVDSIPPDISGAVGPTQFVQWVNTSFAVFDKATGTAKYGPAEGQTLWTGFGGPCERSNDGDPIVLFDRLAGRWIMAQFAVTEEPFAECIAISTTSDALGKYARYQYNFDTFNDYPKLAVWPDGYYATYNMFKGPTFEDPDGAQVCAYDRQKMIAGLTADAQCVALKTSRLLPSDMEGSSAPPVTPPNFLLALDKSRLKLWRFTVNWATPATSRLRGPTNIDVEPFIPACLKAACVPQPAPGNPIDPISDRLMYRNSFRRRGLIDSLLVAHSVFVSGFGGPSSTGVRWYEVQNPMAAMPTVAQDSTYAPDTTTARWLPSIAMDKLGNIGLGYSASSTALSPSIYFAGRSANDQASILSAERAIKTGTGCQSVEYWGDYSMMTMDPSDDCTFWFTSEYLVEVNKDRRWHTYVAHTKFNNCS